MDRRLLLSIIAGSVAVPGMARAVPLPPARGYRLRLINAHTGETFDEPYRDDVGPIPAAMQKLSVFLRDFHVNETIDYDVKVIDFLTAVMAATGQKEAIILSAYRTRETNEALAHTDFGVAENSQHIYGKALDVHFGARLTDAMQAARAMGRGGVGWYPRSGFMHLDSGPVRNWDLDETGLGELVISLGRGRSVPLMAKDARPQTVWERMAREHELERAEYFARHR